jgi:hypothetical protein
MEMMTRRMRRGKDEECHDGDEASEKGKGEEDVDDVLEGGVQRIRVVDRHFV